LRGLFIADPNVTEGEFNRYLDGIDVSRRYPALLRVGYAPLVTNANRAFVETHLREKGLANFQVPAAQAPYVPVLYGYPAPEDALGMNLYADLLRRQAMDAARDKNQPQITGRLTLRYDLRHRPGFILYVPIYGDRIPPVAVEQRRQALTSYLYAAFRGEDLISSTIGPDLNQQMELALFDGNTTNAGDLAYDSGHALEMAALNNQEIYTSVVHLQVSGRPWTFLFVARPQFVLAHQSRLPMAVFIGGFLAIALAGWLANAAAKRMLAEKKIRYLAFHDELTGLPNRAKLRNDLSDAISHGQKTGKSFALLIVELVRFREINYTLGHRIGDEVLKQVGLRLRQAAEKTSTVARISNIQFGLLAPNTDVDDAAALMERLLRAMEAPIPAGEINYELGAHGGIAFFPDHGATSDDLIRHADIALNQARKKGRDYVIYNADQDPYKPQRLALLGAFRHAVKDEQLQLYCQPKADLRTGAITSGEALVRWQHPTFGLLSPDQFISLIEPTELIQLLTQRMLEAAIHQCYTWREQDLVLPLAVNLSTRNLLNPDLPDIIHRLMQPWGADTTWVDLEITESSIMEDPVLSLRVLNQLHMMGLKLFVDDFGTGYSSFSYLMKLPISVIKIDHSFTMNMLTDPDAAVIVKAIIELAHNMGLKVVAEGTASKEIWDALKRLDCDEAQGHYISPPLPANEFSDWLMRSSWRYPTSCK
jgi:diguanylate cyclase (GGDEF)-like protein